MTPLESVTSSWYTLLYSLAVLTAGWVMFDSGRRRGWSTSGWAVATAAWVAAGVVGALIPRLILGDLAAARTSLGAVVAATLALALAARALRIDVPDALDTTAVAIPLGAAIVRIGCFLGECCEGLATSLPIGIAQHSDDLTRHPVQLYEATLEALLALAIVRRQSWPTRPGARILTSVAGLATIRFVTEFVRDNEKFAGLSLAQWVVLPVAIACVALLAGNAQAGNQKRVLSETGRTAAIAWGGVVTLVVLMLGLPPLETATLTLVAIAGAALLARRVCRLAPTGLAVLALQVPPITTDSTYPRTYTSVGGGLTLGTWDAVHRATNCDGVVVENWKRHHSVLGGAIEGGTRHQSTRSRGFGLRARGYFDVDKVGRAVVKTGTPTNPGAYTQHSAGISLVGDADWKYIGISLGASAGRFYPALEDSYYGPSGRPEPVNAFPAVGLRLGRLDGLSIEARFADETPMWVPAPAASIALGFGDSLGNRLRVGASEGGLFVSGRRFNNQGLEIIPSLIIRPGGDSEISNAFVGNIMFRKWIRAAPRTPGEQ